MCKRVNSQLRKGWFKSALKLLVQKISVIRCVFYQVSTFWESLKILVEDTDDQMNKVLIMRKIFCWLFIILFLMRSRLYNVLLFIYGSDPKAGLRIFQNVIYQPYSSQSFLCILRKFDNSWESVLPWNQISRYQIQKQNFK